MCSLQYFSCFALFTGFILKQTSFYVQCTFFYRKFPTNGIHLQINLGLGLSTDVYQAIQKYIRGVCYFSACPPSVFSSCGPAVSLPRDWTSTQSALLCLRMDNSLPIAAQEPVCVCPRNTMEPAARAPYLSLVLCPAVRVPTVKKNTTGEGTGVC